MDRKTSPDSEHLELPPERQPFYLAQNQGFGVAIESDEFLHRQLNETITDDALTETQIFSLCVPAERVYAMGYLWHHPNLQLVTGGIWGWQGVKRHNLACEMFDMRAFMHDRPLIGDLHSYRLENGYGVQVHEPLKRLSMTYRDAARDNEINVEFTALAAPVMFGDGLHFEQPMKARGELRLRGRRYEVDCFTVRDRSWGKPRPEIGMALPPMGWKTGVFGEDFSFNCNAFDEPALMPEFGNDFPLPGGQTLKAGWIYRDGAVSRIVSCRKRTQRDPVTLHPTTIEWEGVDEHGTRYEITGRTLASSDWSVQPNLRFVVSNVQWECRGRVAYGDLQEAHWTDFVNRFLR